jgi:hypothetical protein
MVRIMSVEVRPDTYRVAIDQTVSVETAMNFAKAMHTRLTEDTTEKRFGPHCANLYCPHAEFCFGVEEES